MLNNAPSAGRKASRAEVRARRMLEFCIHAVSLLLPEGGGGKFASSEVYRSVLPGVSFPGCCAAGDMKFALCRSHLAFQTP